MLMVGHCLGFSLKYILQMDERIEFAMCIANIFNIV